MAVITVNSSQSLMTAVAAAKDGDVIKLAAGTYSGVTLSGANFLKNVTITSVDPAHQAVLTDLMINKSKGLTIQGLDLVNTKNADLPFQITGCSNIVLDRLDVTGTGNTVAALNARLMMIRSSSNVQVTNSEFAYGWHGISMLNNKQVTIADNYFHDLRTDGVRGGGNSNLTIKANVFTNFHPTATDHPDAIQLWTVNTSGPSSNIVIDENVIHRGTGSAIQGIFLRDTSGTMPFTNLTVTNNVIEGARYNGIAIGGALNGILSNNIVQAFSDQPSGMRMQAATGITVSGNKASTFFTTLKGIAGQAGNALMGVANDHGGATIAAWLKLHPGFISAWQASDPKVLTDLLSLAGGSGSVPAPTPAGSALASTTAMAMAMALAPSAASLDDDQASGAITALKTAAMSALSVTTPDNVDDIGNPQADDTSIVPTITSADISDGAPATNVVNPTAVIHDTSGDPADDSNANDEDILTLSGDMVASADDLAGNSVNVITIESGARGGVDATEGADVFRFSVNAPPTSNGRPVVFGFESGVDKIIIADENPNAVQALSQPMNFIGSAAFTGQAAEIRYDDRAAGAVVQADIDGDGSVDLEFILRDVHALSVRDFIL